MAPTKNNSNELLEISSKRKVDTLFLMEQADNKARPTKPQIRKPVVSSSDLRTRLDSFLPDLKAANDSLPTDPSSLNIENVDEGDAQYIEMDLGLGVLEEKRDGSSDSSSEVDEENAQDVLGQLMNRRVTARPGIMETESPMSMPESGLLCDETLRHYRTLCPPTLQYEMDIVISLMSRILAQLRKHSMVNQATTITKMNVLREDMYKLMSRRDRLIEPQPAHPKHEALYLDELDRLLEER